MARSRRGASGHLALAAAALAVLLVPGAARADVTCDRVAAPSGSDLAAGTGDAPFATAQKLVDTLAPGQTGCLRAGTYAEHVKVSTGGTSAARVTVTSYPGERARLLGRLWIADSANFVTFSGLDLDGRTAPSCGTGCILPSPTVNGDDARFTRNDITNGHTTICFNVGSNSGWGRALRTVIDHNRIHDCGRLPATNQEHGVYVSAADDTVITDNLIYDNADRGVQLYPDAQRTLVANNVIDGNGEGVIFSGSSSYRSNDNIVRDNVVTNATLRYNIESWWASSKLIGTGNVARHNCVFGGALGDITSPTTGFTAIDNVMADPLYVDRAAKDFRLPATSPCAAMGPAGNILDGAAIGSPANGARVGTASPTFAGTAGPSGGDVTVDVFSGPLAEGTPAQTLVASPDADGRWSAGASSPLAEGTYAARPRQGASDGPATTFTVDLTAPSPTLAAPADGATTGATPTLSGAAGTDPGDAATLTVRLYAGAGATGDPVQTLTARRSGAAWSVTAPVLSSGTYTARVEQRDAADNTGSSAASTFTVDGAAPAVTLTSPLDGSTVRTLTPVLSGAAGTAPGDASAVTVSLFSGKKASGTPVRVLTAQVSAGRWTATVFPAIGRGTYTAQAVQSDAAGNVGRSAPATFAVR